MGILYFLAVLLGTIIAIFIIIKIAVARFNKFLGGKADVDQFVKVVKASKDLARQEYTRKKDVSGMTKLLEPQILEDFPGFNKNLLYSMVESNLTKIFKAVENKSTDKIADDEDLKLMKTFLEEYIADIKERGIDLSYTNVKFHNHAIKSYEKRDGVATITTSSSLEYYYRNSEKDNVYNDLKKQTRYTCKFIYIYDEAKIDTKEEAFTVNCPNCGAPLRGLNVSECEYCSSHIEPVNLKIWKMSSYKEDYE